MIIQEITPLTEDLQFLSRQFSRRRNCSLQIFKQYLRSSVLVTSRCNIRGKDRSPASSIPWTDCTDCGSRSRRTLECVYVWWRWWSRRGNCRGDSRRPSRDDQAITWRHAGCYREVGWKEDLLHSWSPIRPHWPTTARTDDGAWQSACHADAHVALAAATDDPDDVARRAVLLLLRSRQRIPRAGMLRPTLPACEAHRRIHVRADADRKKR